LLQGISQEWWRCESIYGRSCNQLARVGFGRQIIEYSGADIKGNIMNIVYHHMTGTDSV
jgi:hypothetical protein